MPSFSRTSRRRLASCHVDLVRLFDLVVVRFDCSILEGYRGEEDQNEAHRTGRSQIKYPESLHNHKEGDDERSLAVDVAPYPIDWENLDRFRLFAGFVLGVADQLDITLRWGGDWDRDWLMRDQSFHDLPHFELYGR